jgi:hypothetical protein
MSLVDCELSENLASTSGGTGSNLVGSWGELDAVRTRFSSSPFAGLYARHVTRLRLEDCEFVDLPSFRGALISECLDFTVTGCSFIRCGTVGTNLQGGALLVTDSSNGIVEFCTFAYDSTKLAHGGALNIAANVTATVRNNTFYRCYVPSPGVGSAILVSGSATATVSHNIAVECEQPALGRTSGVIPGSGCNLLWNNTVDYYNWDPQAMLTDVHADPLFCDPENLDLTVQTNSPAVPPYSAPCGAIGAHGVGCGPVAVEDTSWGRIKNAFRAIEKGSSK